MSDRFFLPGIFLMNRMRKKPIINNYIVYLGLSYATVLLIPLLIIVTGVSTMLYLYKEQIKEADLDKLVHCVQMIDDELISMTYRVTQVAQNADIRTMAELDKIESSNILQYKEGISALQNIINYATPGLQNDLYIYCNKADTVIYDSTLYRTGLFEKYLEGWGISTEEWHENLVSSKFTGGKYVRSQSGMLQYVQPINAKMNSSANDGVVVSIINTSKINQYFSILLEYGDYSLYIIDPKSNLLYTNNTEYELTVIDDKNGFPLEKASDSVISLTSAYCGWKYYIVLSERALFRKMTLIYSIGIGAGILTIGIMLIMMVHLSVHIGKPIDNLFALIDKEKVEKRNSAKFSEIVARILDSNEQLQEEMEKNKPMQRKAFFHDLLSLDITNPKELRYMAENVGVNIDYEICCIASVKLYANNDFYEIDEQTLSDARVMVQALMEQFEALVGENVWSYQRNYLCTLFIFGGVSAEGVEELVKEMQNLLEEMFGAESNWGISGNCDNILRLWKYCEEAEIAREHCNFHKPVVRYTTDLEDKNSFYFPEAAEERICSSVKAGNSETTKDILNIVFTENFENRIITRSSLMKLNGKLTDLLASLRIEEEETLHYILRLNDFMVHPENFRGDSYFELVREAFLNQCGSVNREKNFQKSQMAARIQKYILENWQNAELGLTMVSRMYQISEGYVSALFKEQTGVNFANYVENVRLEHACELLKTTEMSIDEISGMVGYNSVQSFRRAFKRVYNASPKEYRQG
ncbi:HTH-type transcriptional regulator YesS [Acetatifactor muris]|uniref:HTH-type transcriptional regulator YesS n=2 Tax=Acetatifactor muris TaxID=879566 RepID=A0A2K4ZDZ9_9FIRM|nr:HTH-type transcriptional regulator YesS [Acetatifactor muris]